MRILTSFLFLFSLPAIACDFSPAHKKIVSLSGPVSIALRETGLISKSSVKAVSLFHPISKTEFKGEFLPGGVLLSREKLLNFQDALIFFDESQQLKKILGTFSGKAVELKTRGLTPEAVTQLVISNLKKYVTGCEQAFQKMESKLISLQEELRKIGQGKNVFFFLGEFSFGKYPELLMVNDGVVKWMVEQKLIKTYPSELAYVNWSSKILSQYPGYQKIAIKDSGAALEKRLRKTKNGINMLYPGSLVPGLGQVEGMVFLFKRL